MYLPLSFAMFGGVLSPSSLERCPYLSESLNLAIGRLRLLPASLPELTKSIESTLSALGLRLRLRLPVPVKDLSFDFDNRATLCQLRYDEMEYVLDLSYAEPTGRSIEAFYDALLRAEARWLRRSLAECIGQLSSDRKARQLLCEVLDEVYATGARADEMERCGWTPGLCKLMKGALASLYLELTIDFGHLLEPMDYLDYSTLLRDPCYSHSASPVERQEYEIRQMGNLVKRLLGYKETDVGEEDARALYEGLAELLSSLLPELADRPGLWKGVTVLESFLFLLYSGISCQGETPYRLLSDPRRTTEMLDELYRTRYSTHQKMREGRLAAQWIEGKMREYCFGFLQQKLTHCGSLPRYLYGYLQRQLQVYEEHYDSTFVIIEEREKMSIAPMPSSESEEKDSQDLYDALAALGRTVDDKGERLMNEESLNLLKSNFISFRQTGKVEASCCHRIKLPNRHTEALYGIFFEFCRIHKGEKKAYAKFLSLMSEAVVDVDNLMKNSRRYIRAYNAFVEKRQNHSAF